MFFEYGIVDAGTIIIAVYKCKGIELNKIHVPRFVFGKQDQVIGALIDVFVIIVHNIEFAADDRFDLIFFTFFGKFQGSVHVAVVGHGNRIDVVFLAVTDKLVHFHRAVQQTVFGMQMQMNKIRHWYFSP